MSNKYLKKDVVEPLFKDIFLDPNNPRIAPEEPPGYDNPKRITDPAIQEALENAVRSAYEVDDLARAILSEGWRPVDPIILWEIPKAKGKYVVIEGNTRVTVLRMLRERLDAAKATLARAKTSKKGHTPEAVEALKEQIARLELIQADTVVLRASEVDAADSEELEEILPHLHSVRHINHARSWSPYATSLYLFDEYRKLHKKRHGKLPTQLDDDLVEQVANLVSLTKTKARRNLQSAAAYSNFKLRYASRLQKGDEFKDSDHYFFSIIMEKPWLRRQFGVGDNDLRLESDKEEVLFKWAFSKSRKDVGENEDEKNQNILYKAEALRDWDTIKKYDDDHKTGFHRRLDVESPDEAVSMRKVTADYLNHKTQSRPLDTLKSLLAAVKSLDSEELVANGTQLTPILEELVKAINKRVKMIAIAAE